jgi:hypothetical protein
MVVGQLYDSMNVDPIPGRKLTISEVVQLDVVASSCCIQGRESAHGSSANDDNLLRRHVLKRFDRKGSLGR